ncbi:hypothetical protein [Streptomyces sp. NPDC003327]
MAREAGLAKTTVSAALNGSGRLSPEVRERMDLPESPYVARLTAATAATSLRRGYAVVLLPAGSLQSEWADLSLDAMVVADPVADDAIVEDLLAARIPVLSDRSVEGRPGAYWMDVDAGAEPQAAGVVVAVHTSPSERRSGTGERGASQAAVIRSPGRPSASPGSRGSR